MLKRIATLAAVAAFTGAAAAQGTPSEEKTADALEPGDKAPPIHVETFIKGKPIKEFKDGNVYVVEFWATWCGPCIQAMPHMSELQREYKDEGVRFLGVNIWETQDYTDETLDKIKTFVKKQGRKMDYTVAYDGEAKKMTESYMEAAGRSGIPSAFVVNQEGVIASILHPMSLDDVLHRVVEDDWDPVKDSEKLAQLQQKLGEIYRIVQMGGDAEKGLAMFNEIAGDFPKTAEKYSLVKAQLLMKTGDHDGASEIMTKSVNEAIKNEDAATLNQIAWGIVDPTAEIEERDLDLAKRAAEHAVKLTKEKDANILDTLARVHYWEGDLEKAIEIQKQAVEHSEGMSRESLKGTLEEYKKAATSS